MVRIVRLRPSVTSKHVRYKNQRHQLVRRQCGCESVSSLRSQQVVLIITSNNVDRVWSSHSSLRIMAAKPSYHHSQHCCMHTHQMALNFLDISIYPDKNYQPSFEPDSLTPGEAVLLPESSFFLSTRSIRHNPHAVAPPSKQTE